MTSERMTSSQAEICKCCGEPVIRVGTFDKCDFDGSVFSHEANVFLCSNCGFVHMDSGLTDEVILDHYAEFILYSSLSGPGVGGSSEEDRFRYSYYAKLLPDDSTKHYLDVGCSRGGFLHFLRENSANITAKGVDVDTRSIELAKANGLDVEVGGVFSLPFDDSSFDLLSYIHVVEHIDELSKLFTETRRVLKADGSIIIEVPDTQQYGDDGCYVGPMFWLSLQEHLNHFTPHAMAELLGKNGFTVTSIARNQFPMRNGVNYPSLIFTARRASGSQAADAGTAVELPESDFDFPRFFETEQNKIDAIARTVMEQEPAISFWGIGLEFFALWSRLKMLGFETTGVRLFDMNPGKSGLEVSGISVETPSSTNTDGKLIICSYMSADAILRSAVEMGWGSDQILTLPQIASDI